MGKIIWFRHFMGNPHFVHGGISSASWADGTYGLCAGFGVRSGRALEPIEEEEHHIEADGSREGNLFTPQLRRREFE